MFAGDEWSSGDCDPDSVTLDVPQPWPPRGADDEGNRHSIAADAVSTSHGSSFLEICFQVHGSDPTCLAEPVVGSGRGVLRGASLLFGAEAYALSDLRVIGAGWSLEMSGAYHRYVRSGSSWVQTGDHGVFEGVWTSSFNHNCSAPGVGSFALIPDPL